MKFIKKVISLIAVFLFITFLSIFLFLIPISHLSDRPIPYLYSNIFKELLKPSFKIGKFNILILGLDKRDDQFEKTQTTDTIIFASYDLSKNQLSLVPYPRDLWDYYLNSKINDIYPQSANSADKYDYIKSNYSRIIGQNIDRIVVINTQNLIDLISIIGGVDVYLKQGFTDKQYPNIEYIKNPSPKIPIYVTVSYPAGWNHLDSSNITPFVRSRKSSDSAGSGGTDIGRIERQQLLINSLSTKLKSGYFFYNFSKIFDVYRYWSHNIETNLTDKDIANLIGNGHRSISSIYLNKIEIPIGLTNRDGLIYHPASFINEQWVFIPNDVDYRQLKSYIDNLLNK